MIRDIFVRRHAMFLDVSVRGERREMQCASARRGQFLVVFLRESDHHIGPVLEETEIVLGRNDIQADSWIFLGEPSERRDDERDGDSVGHAQADRAFGVNALPAQVRGQRKNLLIDLLQRQGQLLASRRQIGPRSW